MIKLALKPQQGTYKERPGTETWRIDLDGGRGRYRRDIIGASSRVTVSFPLDQFEFEYFNRFYNSVAKNCSLPFLIDLVLDDVVPSEYVAYFIPGTLEKSIAGGPNHVAVVDLEVIPNANDEIFDTTFVLLYNEFGAEGIVPALDLLAEIVNVDLPEAMPA